MGTQILTVLQLEFSHWHSKKIKSLSHPTDSNTFVIHARRVFPQI